MKVVPRIVVGEFEKTRALASVEREEIEEDSLQGFVLGCDGTWVAMQRVYDFRLDGLMFVRLEDLTAMTSGETDIFQRKLLEEEGLLAEVNFDFSFPDGGVLEWLRKLPSERVVTLENERDDEFLFLIGRIEAIDGEVIKVRSFDREAQWDAELDELQLDDLTSISVGGNYALTYERYFFREGI